MIYKNEDGTNVIQFGTGDIEVGNGRVPEEKGEESFPCCMFVEKTEGEIGKFVNPDSVGEPAKPRSDAHTLFVFTDPRSVDVVIDHLQQAKERFEKNGTKILTMQEITDEVPQRETGL
mgnify:CR=1 FL=1